MQQDETSTMLLLLPGWEHPPAPWFRGGWKGHSLVLGVVQDSSVVPPGLGRGAWRQASKYWAGAEQGQGLGELYTPALVELSLHAARAVCVSSGYFLFSPHCFLCAAALWLPPGWQLPLCSDVAEQILLSNQSSGVLPLPAPHWLHSISFTWGTVVCPCSWGPNSKRKEAVSLLQNSSLTRCRYAQHKGSCSRPLP